MTTEQSARGRPIEPPTIEALPPEMGFGVLDPASVAFEDGRLRARYLDAEDGDLAYAVDWAPGRCRLDAHCAGQLVTLSGYPDLQAALVRSFLGLGPTDPRLVRLCQRLIRLGNVYFRYPDLRPGRATGLLFFPAGLIFELRLPVVPANAAVWEAARTLLACGGGDGRLALVREGPGTIFRLGADGAVRAEAIVVADLSAPLARLPRAVGWLANVIAPGKAYRLAVLDAGVAGDLQVYPGERSRGELAFGVFSGNPGQGDGSGRDPARLFADAARRLIGA
jgi:hypothetical protein